MSSMIFLNFLLLLLLPQVSSEEVEEVEELFRAEDSIVELGYCFGVDYILVYRSGADGDILLGNSSANVTPPVDLQGRIRVNSDIHLLGLQITELTHTDSGMYRRECWDNGKCVSKQAQKLTVCSEEVSSVEIKVKEEGEMTELLCNHASTGQEGTTVHWYRELFPKYRPSLFLDSGKSLKPLLDDLQGKVEVRESGALLLLQSSIFKDNHQFNCLVIRGDTCLSFQNMYLPDYSESRDIFFSLGDRLVLKCPSEGGNQQWETPKGTLNSKDKGSTFMSISFGKKSKDFSLVIPKASEDHSGDYSCISSTLEIQFSLILCPKQESETVLFTEGANVTMSCNVSKDGLKQVKWYRLDPSGDQELIHDSSDNMVHVPEDLDSRLVLSENSSLLSIANLQKTDERRYWCVVLGVPVLLGEEEDFTDDYDDYEYPVGDNSSNGQVWPDTLSCLFKQETVLVRKGGTDPSKDWILYVVIGVIAVVLILTGLGVFIALKKRKKASLKPKDEDCHSPLNTTVDVKVTTEPSSNDRLAQSDENVA